MKQILTNIKKRYKLRYANLQKFIKKHRDDKNLLLQKKLEKRKDRWHSLSKEPKLKRTF